jgi:hypothetical protein
MFMLRWMGIRPLDLYETLGTYWLITASGLVKVWWIIEKANWAFHGIFVQKDLDGLSIDEGILGKLDFAWYHFRL